MVYQSLSLCMTKALRTSSELNMERVLYSVSKRYHAFLSILVNCVCVCVCVCVFVCVFTCKTRVKGPRIRLKYFRCDIGLYLR
ncbi:unnamed protein product [Brassica oleracea var. botrytis]